MHNRISRQHTHSGILTLRNPTVKIMMAQAINFNVVLTLSSLPKTGPAPTPWKASPMPCCGGGRAHILPIRSANGDARLFAFLGFPFNITQINGPTEKTNNTQPV